MACVFFEERRCGFYFAALACLLFAAPACLAEKAAGKNSKKELPGADLFNSSNVVHIDITIPRGGMNLLRNNSWGGGANSRPVARASVSDGKNVYTNVAVHLKGAAGSFRPVDDNPALTLNFEKYATGQSFHGLHKISLNNSIQDPTFITEKLCREMFEAAGVPVPRADFAVVRLNGRDLGLHVLVEGFNKQFLHRYFKNVSGNLYDGGFCKEITDGLEVNSGDKPDDHSDLRRLASAALSARQNNRLHDLANILDLNRFVSMMAMEVIQCHWDGYVMNRNNYRVYHDADTDRMVFMPHGLDQMFGTSGQGSPHTRMIPHMNGLVAGAVIGTTEGRSQYLKRFGELRTNVFKVEAITNRVRELEARIRPILAEVEPGYLSHHQQAVDHLCRNIVERNASLEQQLGVPARAVGFGTNGVVRLEGWTPRNMGSGTLDFSLTKEGRKLLHIAADQGAKAPSWRTKLLLQPGRYRFEGIAMTRGAARENENGANLRISGATTRQRLHGDSEWMQMSYAFEVQESAAEVELVCELKGATGEAWFDPGALRLRRLDAP